MNTESQKLYDLAFEAINDLKAENILRIDVEDISPMCDGVIIASGNSTQHVRSIAENVRVTAKRAGYIVLGIEGEAQGEWVLVDLGDIVVHVMTPEIRDYYELEKIWLVDAKAVDLPAAKEATQKAPKKANIQSVKKPTKKPVKKIITE
jgi:ribosome-associated protein